MILPSRLSYLRSLSSELDVQATRVRELIGSKHWGSDGMHKEALLGGLLQRHLPAGYVISKGFVASESEPNACSREQDLLIVDTNTEAPAFAQHGLIVAFPGQVRASVSVKSQYSGSTLAQAITDLASIASASPPTSSKELWLGLYFFSDSPAPQTLTAPLDVIRQTIPSIARRAAIAEVVVRINSDVVARCSLTDSASQAWSYNAPGLATSCFLARLLAWLAARRDGTSSFDALLSDLEVDSSRSEHVEF